MKYKKAGMVLIAAILALGMGGSFTGCGEKPVDYKPIDMLEESPAQIPDGFLTPEEIPAVEPPTTTKTRGCPTLSIATNPTTIFRAILTILSNTSISGKPLRLRK